MEKILLIQTIGFCLMGIGFAAAYLWLNTISGFKDLKDRNGSLLKWITTCMILPAIVNLVSSLLVEPQNFDAIFDTVAKHYVFISISWLIVAFACGVLSIVFALSKRKFAFVKGEAIRVLFRRALIFSLIMFFLSWLFR